MHHGLAEYGLSDEFPHQSQYVCCTVGCSTDVLVNWLLLMNSFHTNLGMHVSKVDYVPCSGCAVCALVLEYVAGNCRALKWREGDYGSLPL